MRVVTKNFFFLGIYANFSWKIFFILNLLQFFFFFFYMHFTQSLLPFSLFLHCAYGHSGVNESIVPEGARLALQRGLSVGVELWDSVSSGAWAGQRAESLSLLLLFWEREFLGEESRRKKELRWANWEREKRKKARIIHNKLKFVEAQLHSGFVCICDVLM